MTTLLDDAVKEGRDRLCTDCLPILERLCSTSEKRIPRSNRLEVAVIGGGICGLSTAVALSRNGDHITLFDEKSEISVLGAGIQILPNASRGLQSIGVFQHLTAALVHPEHMMIRRWQDGAPIGKVRTKEMKERFGSPFVQVHRGDICQALVKVANENGVNIELSKKAVHIDVHKPSVVFADGSVKNCDLLIVADGINSFARPKILNEPISLKPEAKFVAYRGMIDTDIIEKEPQLNWIVSATAQNCWVGPDRHIQTYSVKGGKVLNIVCIAPLESEERSTNVSAIHDELKAHYSGWEKTIQKIISQIKEPGKWPVWMAPHLPSPVAPGGRVVAVGDAAHDMTPFLGQGAAMTIEDAVVMGRVLSCVHDPAELPGALNIFEAIRVPRTRMIKVQALGNVDLWHLHDGPEQQGRDAAAQAEVTDNDVTSSPYIWSDKQGLQWLFEYDLDQVFEKLRDQLREDSR